MFNQNAFHENQHPIFSQVAASAEQHLDVQLRPGQLAAGGQLLQRSIVEMQTGEGKTLTMVLPAAVLAKRYPCVLIATANDYLVERDADWMRPIYQDLGLSVASVTSASTSAHRTLAYRSNVVYGTLREFAFDFLRGSLAARASKHRDAAAIPFDVLIVDEADSLLIDEARTPLIITAAKGPVNEANEVCYRWCAQQTSHYIHGEDFVSLADRGAIALTERGHRKFLLASMPVVMARLTTTQILHALERALWASLNIHRDHDYVVTDGRIHLVDEYTGRKSSERHFGAGIQQAIEAREGLPLSPEPEPVARISVQEFVAKFTHLSGITATAYEDRRELRNVYGLNVKRVAPHLPSRRVMLEPVVCATIQQKWQQIALETLQMIDQGRCVLIGTRSVADSEALGDCFKQQGIEHVVLNARNHAREAEVIRQAGQRGRVTIATNMAGRGTDIRLAAEVALAGGLHVIVSERHAAARIDRQLIGRGARQGDPGSSRVFLSPEDELLATTMGPRWNSLYSTRDLNSRWLVAKAQQAQRIATKRHRQERAALAAGEMLLNKSMLQLGLDPYLDSVAGRID
jgi:preprotein translocase subunit SecA